MTINHLQLNEEVVKVHLHAGSLDRLMREGQEKLLFIALSEIEMAARRAQEVLNDLKYSK